MSEIIHLKERRKSQCKHLTVAVDETLDQVECEDCGEVLNPVVVLRDIARRGLSTNH
ncbi:hypothetical protein GGR95_002978 [Sulfitobacter undariae]|uniref:Uncharacterized protein n=1 Tax=Sulfitobacter undariae TaxID=1563671 RepID=A0A7W6EBU3_9RHOB|nr:hypothetical protein [Sulfitobacter undariae]MBB3995323.1 hypothetical protein [Sulfitobacter undariae]